MRELLCAALRAQHFAVDAVASADDATPHDPDTYAFVLADVPFGETCHTFAEHMDAYRSRLVLMSTSEDDWEMQTAEDPPLLHKPFDRKALLEIIPRH